MDRTVHIEVGLVLLVLLMLLQAFTICVVSRDKCQ
jgi:hypothetical protein